MNIDQKCAKYGFNMCSYLDAIRNKMEELKEVKKDPVTLIKKLELKEIHGFGEFNEYVKTNELENLKKRADEIQEGNLSSKEKMDELLKLCGNIVSNSAKEYENTIRKTLGILTNDGVFACIVWIESNEREKGYRAIKYQTSKFLSEISEEFSGIPSKLREEIMSICNNIHQMFFVKQILEQMLTYALYRARSLR